METLSAPRLSIVLIVKNEAGTIAECLEPLNWADEIVILDSGSSDATIEIAKRYTDKVFVDADWQGYGVQRQRAQSKAGGDWILMLDADERFTPELVESIQQAIKTDDRNKVYALPRLSYCFGSFIRHCGWYPDYVTRLYPREKAAYNDVRVHEKLSYPKEMRCVKLKGDMLHYTYNNIEHYLVKSAKYADEWAKQKMARGKSASLFQGILHALGCFVRMYILRAGFLDGRQGFLLSLLSAHSTFVKYAALWEKRL